MKHLQAPCFAAEHEYGIVSGLETSVAEFQNELSVRIEANCMFDFGLPQTLQMFARKRPRDPHMLAWDFAIL